MTVNPEIVLRRAVQEDLEKVVWVESLSTPNLSYVPHVWEMFLGDEEGDWTVAEIDGEVIGCGKYSVLPDGSAWLETLRVVPQRQGLGVGKRLYEHWLRLSREKGVKTMRMYTGVRNVVSKGLAERYGLRMAETFRGTLMKSDPGKVDAEHGFRRVTDHSIATELLMRRSNAWGGWLVMNRTFYKLSPELCAYLAERGMVYMDPDTESVIAMGARFMPGHGLHIGLFAGDAEACLGFAMQTAVERGIERLHCLFPSRIPCIEESLTGFGFRLEPADFIVMEVHLE
jgi:N-acetylglutamate synthase-like GNAT family acetyltransferase